MEHACEMPLHASPVLPPLTSSVVAGMASDGRVSVAGASVVGRAAALAHVDPSLA